MVMNIISLPGVVAPEVAAQFKLAIEKVAAKPLKEQVAARKKLLKELAKAPSPDAAKALVNDQQVSGQKTSGQKTSGQKTSGQKTSGQEASGQKAVVPEKKSPTTPEVSDAAPKSPKSDDAVETVKGYKMEDIKTDDQDTQMTSSGVQWAAGLFILLLLGLFFFGSRRRRR
jgi:cobaltochelatase CobN